MDKRKGVKESEEGRKNVKSGQRPANFSGYAMFTEEYFIKKKEDKNKGKGKKKQNEGVGWKSFKELNLEVRAAWYRLTDKDRAQYSKRAEEARGPSSGKKYVVPFHTRCAPKQFISVCNYIKTQPELMERLKNIGFDKLVGICCTQINRDLCAEFMRCYDPPTMQVRIRGRSRGIAPVDVREIMGLPLGGEKIEANCDDKDPVFQDLKTVYKGVAYQRIADWLKGPANKDFEFLFVLFALGTLLSPASSVVVSERVLKLMRETMRGIRGYDWCAFILSDLCESISDFKKDLLKGNSKGRKTIGGCLYFLMVFCLQHFALGKLAARADSEAMSFWNDERVKSRLTLEKESKHGLLHNFKRGGQSHATFNPETQLTHPELQRTYARIMGFVGEELLALQNRLLEDEEMPKEDDEGPEEHVAEEEDKGAEHEDGDADQEGAHMADSYYDVEAHEEDEGAGAEHVDPDPEAEEDGGKDGQGGEYLRRSQRTVTPSWVVKSPWIQLKHKAKGKRVHDERESLFQLCTATRPQGDDDGDEVFMEMHGYFIHKRELYCLRRRGWINNTVMSIVARTLVAEEVEKHGRVSRHIFTAHFMSNIVDNPIRWSVEHNEAQILPQYVGYNIGECDFIFGPAVFNDHWFCYVLHTKTMRFYVLDSLVDNVTYFRRLHEASSSTGGHTAAETTKKKNKGKGGMDPKLRMAYGARNCFLKIIRHVKPELLNNVDNVNDEVTWAKVHIQRDTDSCGVHVLSWLQMWDGSEGDDGYTMPHYSDDELHQLKIGVLWWLVTNPKNIHKQKVMSILEGYEKTAKMR